MTSKKGNLDFSEVVLGELSLGLEPGRAHH
jgi:hypothetical protein